MSTLSFSERARRMQPSAIRKIVKLAAAAGGDLISFAGGMPSPATFPLNQLAAIASSEISNHQGRTLQYGLTTGYRPLVQWICNYVRAKGIVTLPDQVVCTTGSQQALDLITEILIDPGDVIFVEVPTYIGALAVFQKSGARLVPVQQDSDGIVLDDLQKKLQVVPRDTHKLIYLISNFQNPSGISLAEQRRKEITNLLKEYDAYLVEDDPYGEIYFGEPNKPPAPVKHWLANRVFYLGTFSKLVAPTFRTGWVIAEESLAQKIELAKEAADLCGSLLDQRILHRFCSSKDFEAHLVRLRSYYAERCSAMLEALSREMPTGVYWTQPAGGFFVWLKLPAYLDSESFLEECIAKEKVTFVIGAAFTCDGSGKNFLRLAFSVENPDRIQEGIARLASLIRRRI